ncbi:hypothetical protein H109_04459 [Trichophyton interdigitale MR816]|uniref:Uncharacterized protein n=1 Tax=Trichophyton interdigitale (strain MR816) TaxID=1215338 RepID=A0A059J887_TRIIM|nr:hypothetical protein H101_02386 [Trichophyton interdigitale H6]KDB23667.1 hypothetical protein H109_04459 [Trichophyton interdigitale MR816]
MSLLSSFKGSILSATNENNASLANLKFDFSLVKVEAPVEFQPLGSALTFRRRDEAEYGPQHQTARRLAALFEPLVPSTPRLISAYGTRVSEIIESPGVNPTGSRAHGPFKEYIGTDGTAVWAAATSGVAALGIYLLSCLLARAWDSREAISIWVELIEERKQEIQSAFGRNVPVSAASAMSSLQPIARHDIALWDASSRSWLRSADQAKQRDHHQLLLISKNVRMPFFGGSSTYEQVISTWKRAMLAVEDLLCGRPQSILDAGVVLAMSSWHLYPDMIVLRNETVNVKFRDPLFPSTGICTIGLEGSDEAAAEGVRWSLALSHLQYYGSAARVMGPRDNSRVTMSQLCIVAFGGLLGHWGVGSKDVEDTIQLFCCIGDILNSPASEAQPELHIQKPERWINPIIQACRKLSSSKGEEKEENTRLLRYGQRRATKFLRRDEDNIPPYFGLCNQLLLSALCGDDCDLTYLRGLAQSMGYASSDCLIVQAHWVGRGWKSGRPHYFEYATATPLWIKAAGKRSSEGDEIYNEMHAKWYSICSDSGGSAEKVEKEINSRVKRINLDPTTNERCFFTKHGQTTTDSELLSVKWHNPPPLFRCREGQGPARGPAAISDMTCLVADEPTSTCSCFELELPNTFVSTAGQAYSGFINVYGSRRFALFVRDTPNSRSQHDKFVKCGAISPKQAVQQLCRHPIQLAKMTEYLNMTQPKKPVAGTDLFILSNSRIVSSHTSAALHALYLATLIYSKLEGLTVLLRIASQPLCDAGWVLDAPISAVRSKARKTSPQAPSRQEGFACIAHFDSGQANIRPSDLDSTLAMCSQNSIFVAAVVLSDPLEKVEDYEVRRLVGNIGKRGISMLVAPRNPQIREPKDDYCIVNHAPYDRKRENNFNDTSLHLSFTEWTLPLATADSQTIDQDVFLVESVISVRDRGEWVADLDILGINKSEMLFGNGLDFPSLEDDEDDENAMLMYEYTSIDSWEELLDPPLGVGIFRARGNWVARLAAVSILMQRKKGTDMAIFEKNFSLRSFEALLRSNVEARAAKPPETFICID